MEKAVSAFVNSNVEIHDLSRHQGCMTAVKRALEAAGYSHGDSRD